MNRILKYKDKFSVLITPTYTTSPSFEILLGNWTDEHLRGFKVMEFADLESAMEMAFKYPSIDWNKLVSAHEDSYQLISNSVKNNLSNGSFIVEIDSHLMNPTELKETMFKRVKHHGERFSLFYDANDIISINIINPWTQNLVEIANLLKTVPELRIKKMITTPTHITLIGATDIGTLYEIRLWTSIFAQWARWILYSNLDPKLYINMLGQLKEKQNVIDDGDIIR